MFGVVLWCSENGEKAVIWCEDHGDLAFFHDVNNRQVLEAGDMVRFRTETACRMRLARDLVLVAQDGFRDLPERLKAAGRSGQQAVVRRITPAA